MTIKSSTLRPGLLVSLKTSVTGNVKYTKTPTTTERVKKGGPLKARWETERTIFDPVEHEAATKVRARARQVIRSVCADSAFGMLCPETSAEDLEKAIAEARRVSEQFNQNAKLSRVHVYVITGRIASDDAEAVRAINSEVRDLLAEMEKGVKNMDAKAIRDAASRSRSLGSMLSPDAAARIRIAIDAARGAARTIVQAGEAAAVEVDKGAIRALKEARTAFLDIEPAQSIAKPKGGGKRAVDLAPAADAVASKRKPARAAAEVE